MINRIKALAKEFKNDIVETRRHIHKFPCLSFVEFDTAEYIGSRLSSWNIKYEKVGATGIVATIEGNNPAKKVVALRADIDALPIQEKNNCSYKSVVDGVMHACGHDAHTAMLLGVANILNNVKNYFEGTIKLVFQPGEEKLPGGASLMIKDGVLNDVDVIIAQHVYPDLPCGKVGFHAGEYMASCDEINIHIKGRGGHAAKIEERDNTTVAAARMLCAISELSSEFSNEKKENPVIIAFGGIESKGTYNVIPSRIHLKGTMRTFDEAERKAVKNKIRKICSEIARSMGVSSRVVIEAGYPVLKNDVELTESMRDKAVDIMGNDQVMSIPRLMTAEDFAWYSHKVKACMYRIGTSNAEKGITSKQHTPHFDIDEDALEIGTGLMAYLAIESL